MSVVENQVEKWLKHGGPAFPTRMEFQTGRSEKTTADYKGMTLRDYFAGQVLSGCAEWAETRKEAADHAYSVADAMLKARENEQ